MRKITALTTVLFLIVAATATACAGQKYLLKLGHGAQDTHPLQVISEKMAEIVKEKTNGEVVIQVYPNRQLGEERDMVEGLQLGTVDMTITSTGPLSGFVPEVGVVDLPFLFKSSEHAYKVLDGPIGQAIFDKFEPKGIVGLAYMENGWRHITCKNKVETPGDLKGLKIRTMQNKVHMAAFKAMGAAPIPMVWGEVYTSLQQGVIDGQENPLAIIYPGALWEVQKYLALSGHFYGVYTFLMSKRSLNKLPVEYQEIVRRTAKEMAPIQRQLLASQEAEQIVELRKNGMDVYEVNRDLFREAVAPVYAEFEPVFGKELVDRIRNTD